MNIIPAIDIINGQCVRLTQGDYSRVKKYSPDPVKAAVDFKNQGASILHVIDLDGARLGYPKNKKIIIKIARLTGLPIIVGGGIRDFRSASELLSAGISRVILGSAAFKNDLARKLIEKYGAERVMVAVDVKRGKIMTDGWLKISTLGMAGYLSRIKKIGIQYILVTDISKDGTLTGPNWNLIKSVIKKEFNVIAAGGISSLDDLARLDRLGTGGAVIGKAIYEKRINLREAVDYFSRSNLAKRIIPCLDVKGGRVVKGTHFKNLVDVGDAVELAKLYSRAGADELVFLDISATAENRKTLIKLVAAVAKNINIPFTVGGGINNIKDVKKLLMAGADKVSLGTAAVRNPALVKKISQKFGSQCLVISVDVKKSGEKWAVYIKGGKQVTPIDAIVFARKMEKCGAGELLVNSLDRDGTKKGFDIELLDKISQAVNIPVIASSGAGSVKDFFEGLAKTEVSAVLAASVFHHGLIMIGQLKQYLKNNKIIVRL